MEDARETFEREGYAGPFKLFDPPAAEALLLERYMPAEKLTWYKSPHEKSAPIVRTATAPIVLEKLKTLLGENILLWGSHFIAQHPEQSHGWHLDVEYGRWNGVTLWLGLKNLNTKTTVSLITRSHLLSTVPGVLAKTAGIDIYDDAAILREAQKLDPKCELKTFTLNAGEFIIWSGRAWHTTLNKSDKRRFSLIMQFCTPENVTRVPLTYDYPDTKWSDKRPPCVLVAGEDNFRQNELVPRQDIEPTFEVARRVRTRIYQARHYLHALGRKLSG